MECLNIALSVATSGSQRGAESTARANLIALGLRRSSKMPFYASVDEGRRSQCNGLLTSSFRASLGPMPRGIRPVVADCQLHQRHLWDFVGSRDTGVRAEPTHDRIS